MLRALVYALPLLVVASAVVMGAAALAQAMGDQAGARVMLRIGTACGLLLAADSILLLGVLGARALTDDEQTK
jgi:hypothetical protein